MPQVFAESEASWSMWKRIGFFSVTLIGVVIGAMLYDRHEDRLFRISIKGDTPVMAKPYPAGALSDNQIVEVAHPGDVVHVMRVRYGKGYLAFKVRLADGMKGYLISGSSFSYSR